MSVRSKLRNRIRFPPDLVEPDSIAAALSTLIDTPLCNEMSLKAFFETYPAVIPTVWRLNHGIHFRLILPQFQLSPSYACDFLYLTKSTATWWCVLIEIESPCARLFQEKAKT